MIAIPTDFDCCHILNDEEIAAVCDADRRTVRPLTGEGAYIEILS